MPLDSTHIVLKQPERLTDQSDGGGQITSVVLPDNVSNNLFPGVSNLDAVNGRLSARSLYLSVASANTLWYYGAGIYISQPPANPAISALLARAASFGEERAALATRIESYLTQGPIFPIVFYGNAVPGQRVVSGYQNKSAPIPSTGDSLILSQEQSGYPAVAQYVRVADVTASLQTFEDSQGEFVRRVVQLFLVEPLRYAFAGMDAPLRYTNVLAPTKVRMTSIADAARYYGALPLAAQANSTSTSVLVDRVLEQLVPASQAATPLLDIPASAGVTVTVSGGARSVDFPVVAHTLNVPITAINRQLSYVFLLTPKPAPGSVLIRFRIMGKWYAAQDDGSGSLSGDAVGTINYATGSGSLTLPALPDVYSSLMCAWGTPLHFDQPALSGATVEFEGWSHTLPVVDLDLGSVMVTWAAGGVTKFASSDAQGKLSGDGDGQVEPNGHLVLKPLVLPDPNSTPVVTFQKRTPKVETFTPTKDGSGNLTITTAHPIRPGSLSLYWTTERAATAAEQTLGYAS
jgi:hypothetical protein